MQQNYPLTREQERLWIEWKIAPLSHSYNTNIQFKLVGDLDVERFKEALSSVVRIYDAFRTSFAETDGVPHQTILADVRIQVEYIDLSADTQNATLADEHADTILTEKLRAPFDLLSFPLTRFCLVKAAPQIYYFIYVMPHIILDGHSAKMFSQALSIAYNQGASDIEKLLKLAPTTIGDYHTYITKKQDPAWQEAAGHYWHEALKDTHLHLDIDYARQNQSLDKTGERFHFTLSADTYKSLKLLARKERTTPFVVLASMFGIFLYRYFNQSKFAILYPTDIRPTEFKHLYGFLVNNLPLRMDFSALPNFSEVASHITNQRRSDRHYEDWSLKDIIRGLRQEGLAKHNALFNIMFAEANFSLSSLKLDGIEVHARPCNYGEVNSDLALFYDGTADTLELAWDYKTSLFDRDFIKGASSTFTMLVEEILKDPTCSVDRLPLLDDSSKAEILALATGKEPPVDERCLHQLMEEQAQKNPHAIAIIYNDQRMTYAELNARSERLAGYLEEKGIGSNSRVVLFMERSLDVIISILAVLKTGAAYVAIDTGNPNKRLDWMLGDSNPSLILTQEHLLSVLETKTPTLCVDGFLAKDTSHVLANTKRVVGSDSVAYIIYTSGSTGTPKGVMVTHRNAVNRISWLGKTLLLDVGEPALQNMNHCFDPSVYEIFHPLSLGATLVLPNKQASKQPRQLIDLIEHHRIKAACFVPSLWQSIFSVLQEGEGKSLVYVTAGGEVLSPQLVDTMHQRLDAEVYNFYGPTEAAILATSHHCKRGEKRTLTPIGRPLDHTRMYVFDHNQQLQPLGVAGEIYIGGIGVAKGYLNNSSLSQERFITDPFNSGERLYKTRDRGRYIPGGNIEFLGRMDDQVKIRGHRIELGEIEMVIRHSGLVEDTVVLVYEIGVSSKQLIAYCILKENITVQTLRHVLATSLPDYMIPAHFIAMESLPLTSNGKINKNALPKLIEEQSKTKGECLAPRNPTEEVLRDIWANLLRRDKTTIGVKDRFFDIGGDSLMTIELTLLVEKNLHIKISDSHAFSMPTIEDWAQHILAKTVSDTSGEIIQNKANQRKQAMLARQKLQETIYG